MPSIKYSPLFALLASACLFTACGNNVCERAEEANAALDSKKGSCDVTSTGGTSKAACEAAISKCSNADQDKLLEMFDCMEAVSTCQAGNEFAWLVEVGACGEKIDGISAECGAAFGE